MTERFVDPLEIKLQNPDQVFYATGVLLDADDFKAEQLYHRSRLARALAYLHGSGTVAGLKVVWEQAIETTETQAGREERLIVKPGLAIDRLGRLIELPRSACIRLNRWFEAQTESDLIQAFHAPSNSVMISRNFLPDPEHPNERPIELGNGVSGVVVDVFLGFTLCERGKTPALATGPFDALDAVVPSRLRDGYQLSLVLRQEPTDDLLGILPANDWIQDLNPTEVQRRILAAWQEASQGDQTNTVFLARLLLPATNETGGRPQRIMTEEVIVDNYSRAFSYPSGAIMQLIELSS